MWLIFFHATGTHHNRYGKLHVPTIFQRCFYFTLKMKIIYVPHSIVSIRTSICVPINSYVFHNSIRKNCSRDAFRENFQSPFEYKNISSRRKHTYKARLVILSDALPVQTTNYNYNVIML